MNKLVYILILLTSLMCGPSNKPISTLFNSSLPDLKTKAELYIKSIKSQQDADGFIFSNTCDSLIFTGLLAAARPDLNINILAAKDNTTEQWYRRPARDCSPDIGNSRSTISRDMILGVMWYMWRNKDLESANDLMLQLKSNNYTLLGSGTAAELVMTPTMIQTLAEMIYKLGGPNYTTERLLPEIFQRKDTGYVAHLTAWHIALRGDIFKGLSALELAVIKAQTARQPNNPLFQAIYHKYVDGNYSSVLKLLLNTSQWPQTLLPTSNNHCEPWPIQRDAPSKDWEPCKPLKTFSGAELPVIYYLIIDSEAQHG